MFLLTEVHNGDFWTEVWSIALDPAHMVAELLSAIVIDVIIVALMYKLIFKQFILPRWQKRIHMEIDEEHGYEHDEKGKPRKTSDKK